MAKPCKKNPNGEQKKPKRDNPNTVRKLEEAFSLDCSIEEACFYADISRQTYYDLIKDKPLLLDRFEALRNKPVLMARQEVIKGIRNNPELALKYLERKRKDEFSTKQEINNNLSGEIKTSSSLDKMNNLLKK